MNEIQSFLSRCSLGEDLREHVRVVLEGMPEEVVVGLVRDESFVVVEYDAAPGGRGTFVVPALGKGPVRAVVLKTRMWRREEAFVRWVIAHELAHAHLGNRGRYEGEDPEYAADALAAEWGFARPAR